MKEILRSMTAIVFFSIIASAQYASAPNNYYPADYTGSIFTGVVTETSDNQITLTFTKDSKTDTFTGIFKIGCSVPAAQKSGRLMTPLDIPKGTVMTAFFDTNTKKVNGKKAKENSIIAIAFDIWQGQKIPADKKMMYWCTDSRHLQFRAYH